MSQSSIARFPQNSLPGRDHDAHAANEARKRIAALPDPYLEHATPAKEYLVGAIQPVSPAAEAAEGQSAIQGLAKATAAGVAAESHAGTTATAGVTAANPLATPQEAIGTAKTAGTGPTPPKPNRSLPSRLRPLLIGIGTFVILYFIFKPELLLSQLNYLTQPKTTTKATQAVAAIPPQPTISIPKINVNAPVVYATSNDENAILTDLESGVVHYANTALPGQPGNSVIFGHSSNDWWEPGNYKFVFVLLDKLVPGDTFSVNYNSHQYIYQVTSSTVVDPTDVAVLNQTPDPEMTLITCSPPGTSWKRLVVVAKQVSPAPATASTPASNTPKQSGGTLPSNSRSLNDVLGGWWGSIKSFLGGGSSKPSNPAPATTPSTTGTLPAVQ